MDSDSPGNIDSVRFQRADLLRIEECPTQYLTGGFYPVRLGDVYGSNYKVIRKLGCGAYSTVWLAEELRFLPTCSADVRSGQAVALKVLASNASRRELDIMKRLRESSLKSEGAKYVVQMLDHFEHIGPNGSHLCVVMELMWQDVLGFLEGYRYELEQRLPLVKRLSEQIFEGLNYVHECGVIHNGS